ADLDLVLTAGGERGERDDDAGGAEREDQPTVCHGGCTSGQARGMPVHVRVSSSAVLRGADTAGEVGHGDARAQRNDAWLLGVFGRDGVGDGLDRYPGTDAVHRDPG